MEVRTRGVVGASVAGVCALGATSPFNGVTVGLGRSGCEGVVGRKSIALGTGPIDMSMLVAQSNRCEGTEVLRWGGKQVYRVVKVWKQVWESLSIYSTDY